MNNTRTWIVATSLAAVEGLKDQGFARWNYYPIKSIQQHVKNNVRSYSQAKRVSSSSSTLISNKIDDKLKEAEDSLKHVMYLNCWGPN
ncbi:hypothetical protein BVRB_4g093300 [Beta vulgaris subsp. vulgaris]|uniref:Wound-responsive family protein n=1 Tax=Beta vulgaris subsp. vulgaris TaxID=3555 RepID=A0A0J8BAI0_BETVV|nr:hypothetical protein BVRB_4g093300 [Beta vulgaris subsp. vulgaris]